MGPRLIGIVLASAIGFAQAPTPTPGELWRNIRNTLTSSEGDGFFQKIKDAQIPPAHLRFSGNVVSQPSPNELIVSVDDPAGDARLHLSFALRRAVSVATTVHFEGVIRSWTKSPYSLTFDVLRADIDGLP